MCGIYGLVSSRSVSSGPSDELFRHLEALLHDADAGSLASVLSEEESTRRVHELLDAARAAAARWTGRSRILAVLLDASLADRLRGAVVRVNRWVESLERFASGGHAVVREHREVLNRLALGGRDIAWQLERDVLDSLDGVRELVGTSDPVAASRAWELNLILRSLDRLEVRGRDSAGIAVYVRFPSATALDAFLDERGSGVSRRQRVEDRVDARLVHGSVVRPQSARDTLLFAFKVASEVGKMGDNVAYLRRAIRSDDLFRDALTAADTRIQCLAHTRWASNGVISLPNCHPVDSSVISAEDHALLGSGDLVAVLNGDIDNYQQLVERYVTGRGARIDPAVTTDAKIIPVVVAAHLEECDGLEQAFARAFAEFEGSMAIGLMAADRPDEILFAQKGSGQGLFFGEAGESIAVASEMYGVVELTPRYFKAEGERSDAGEVFRLRSTESGVEVCSVGRDGVCTVPAERWRLAEITTRDINRAGYPHFFLKEITESVDSVRKTIRGKVETRGHDVPQFSLGAESLPPALIAGLREGRVRRICVLGQGTAAVAAQGVAHLLDVALRRAPYPVAVTAEKATEYSAHRLRDDMSDTLVVAVSQSGTTTDTNRTVDLVRQRGAWVLGIVNRRNSDLVYKSHAVLYTSDGRDIEMSVASTKAFYAQNVAGQVLALALASALGSLDEHELQVAAEELERLPEILRRTLEAESRVAELARRFALRRRHWAVVGSGASKIAADEVRIKLSELCYKSIAVDYLEDKKHIDLSSEPLVIVCAVGMAPEIVSDAVKEVAIFKAHNAIPIVFTDEGETGFDPYAAGSVKLPRCRGALSYLPVTMAGHLFGYHAAAAMDSVADELRSLRAQLVALGESSAVIGEDVGAVLDALSSTATSRLHALEELLESRRLDGGLDVGSAVRLDRVLQLCLGRLPVDRFRRAPDLPVDVLDAVVSTLSDAISELSRPIDAIKHQAKTVTVGISRGEATVSSGVLATALEALELDDECLLETHRRFLSAFDPLVSSVRGVSIYEVRGLDPLGRPGDGSEIRVERKLGCAASIESRSEEASPLSGNKWAVVKRRAVFLGRGQTDERKILIVPFIGEQERGRLALFHVELVDKGERSQRLRALAANGSFLDRLRAAVTEVQLEWDPSLIDAVDNDTLFLESPEKVAELLAHARV